MALGCLLLCEERRVSQTCLLLVLLAFNVFTTDQMDGIVVNKAGIRGVVFVGFSKTEKVPYFFRKVIGTLVKLVLVFVVRFQIAFLVIAVLPSSSYMMKTSELESLD